MEQKSKMLKFREDHQKHKDDAQDALEYYQKLSVETRVKYAQITSLLSEDVMLTELQSEYSAFVSADYMMSKNYALAKACKSAQIACCTLAQWCAKACKSATASFCSPAR